MSGASRHCMVVAFYTSSEGLIYTLDCSIGLAPGLPLSLSTGFIMILLVTNLILYVLLIAAVARLGGNEQNLSRRILFGLLAGVGFGLFLQLAYSNTAAVIAETLTWTNVIGSIYVNLLKMIS